jgi:hypothetical protein
MPIKYENNLAKERYYNEEHWIYRWRITLGLTKHDPSTPEKVISDVQSAFTEIEIYFRNRLSQNTSSDSQIEGRLTAINKDVFRFPNGKPKKGMFIDFNNFGIYHPGTDSGKEIADLMETITGLSFHDKDWIQENYPGLHAFGKYAEQQIKSQE